MNIHFYIDGKAEPKLIYLRIARFKIKIYTKHKTITKDWDKKRQRTKRNPIINELLNTIETIASDTITANITNNIVTTKAHIIDAIAQRTTLYQTTTPPTQYFYHYAQQFRDHKPTWSRGYTKAFNSWLNTFHKTYPNILFADMDYTFYKTYLAHGLDKYRVNTFNTHWRKFKSVLDDAYYSGMPVNMAYKKIKVGTEIIDSIYLDSQEITRWIDQLHTLEDYLRNASALFLIGCLTGLRYSDFTNMHTTTTIHKEGTKYYRVNTKKTKSLVTIPSNPQIEYLLSLDAHDISNQKMNKYIKIAGELLGINTPTHSNGTTIPKYQLIQTHTARRSFATNAVLSGIPISFIMAITGHKTEIEFRKYVRIDDIQSAIQFNKYSQ